jgi:spectinomycin phosphotransferase
VRIEPDLNQSRLLELLRDRYLLEVVRLTFVPYGIDSWSYVAACRDGSQAFVKLSRRAPSTNPDSEIPLLAALAARRVAVPRPVADRDGGFLNAVDGYEVQVLEYLEGRTLEDETAWSDDLYAKVAETVAAVHASTSAVRHLVERVERYELPFLPRFAETLTVIEAGGALPVGDDPTLATLGEMVIPRARELRVAIGRLQHLRDLAKVRDSDEVLCHTDIWGSNLLRSDDGTLHLLDWNGALLGPPEHDLFMFAGTEFFPADRFGWFLDRYEAAFRRMRLNADTFGFYSYRRNLEDLASFVDSIAEGRTEAMGPDATLGVVADLLAELPRLDGRIRHVTDVLSNARPTSSRL